MSVHAEHTIFEFLSLFDAPQLDFPRIMSYVADDVRYEARVTHAEPIRGREAMEQNLRGLYARYASAGFKILSTASNASQVFTQRVDTVHMKDGRHVEALVCGIFDIDAAGKISGWHDYWDLDDVKAQLAPPHA
jgi:limonene-1,2-epoxide hydrolase